VRALGAAVTAVAAIVKVPGPVRTAVTVVEPVDATAAVNGMTSTTATAEPVLAATTTELSAAEPVDDAVTAIPFDIIDVEVVSATVPEGTVTVHVTGAATAGWVVASRLEVTVAATSCSAAVITELLNDVKVMTYVPGSVGVKLTPIFALAKAYVVAETAVSIHENCKPSVVTTGTFVFVWTRPAVEPANTGITELPVGADVRVILTDIVSPFTPRKPWVMLFVIRAAEPVAQVVVAEVRVNVSDCGTAFEGATDRRPSPSQQQ
jgi:hypothetical protein